MRYMVAILLLASTAFSAEPAHSWQFRNDDPNQVYLYLDAKQIGRWNYRTKQYRPFDGKNWGPPSDTAPVPPPMPNMVVGKQQKQMAKTQPGPTPNQLRGPIRIRLGTAMGQVITDMTMKVIEEIPGAIVESLAKGHYQLDYQLSVTPLGEQPEIRTTPPSPSQPGRSPQRRWLIPRR